MRFSHDPHHDGSPDFVTPHGDHVHVRVRVPGGADGVYARVVEDGEARLFETRVEHRDTGVTWYGADLPRLPVVTSYRFAIVRDRHYTWLNQEGPHDHEVTDDGDFRFLDAPAPPSWVPGTTVYQIFPDRFARDDDSVAPPTEHPEWAVPRSWDDEPSQFGAQAPREFYGGTLEGVRRHLDHLADLGAEVVYLTPFFPARSTHRYDASSFDEVDPWLGGDAALTALVREARSRGMRVMGDLTTNHTGDEHVWFLAARADAGSTEAGFYHFTEHPDSYVSWLGVRSLPKLDYTDPVLRERVYGADDSVLTSRLVGPDRLDGWRIDVANMTGRLGDLDINREVSGEIAARTRAVAPEAWLLAEHFYDAGPDTRHDGWHGVMNYAGFTRPVWAWLNTGPEGVRYAATHTSAPLPTSGAAEAVRALRAANAGLPWRVRTHSVNALSTHDSARFRTVVDDPVRQVVGVAAQAALPGVPFVFAGDEIGLRGRDGENARHTMPWHRPDDWDSEVLAAHRRLLALHRNLPALQSGGLRWLDAGEHHMTFLRTLGAQVVLVHLTDGAHAERTCDPTALDVASLSVVENGGAVRSRFDDGVRLSADGPGHVVAVGTSTRAVTA
ncbi:glycoside hydrolase family 13 protein [Nocardiopsis sp. MG754419]|uniref:glycoside hydrolase family 13 protein n=1 Tax=Nocardiopsis sp. MG754419 TaxID=2259865 RepID=UPI001BAE19F2|nr:glycoside hydrolase family 13 protein [Nocardiopsis sp. MG754419]MBR8744258.1 glycoside hydrolase family 13 protein [Nocardiopsis sp. MG754419]